MKTFLASIPALFLMTGALLAAPGDPGGPEEDVLRPLLIRFWAGPMGGIGYNLHLGNFETQCRCVYSGGSGFGPLAGLSVEFPVAERWRIAGGISYQDHRADFTRTETRLEYGSSGEFVNIDFEQTAAINLSYVGVHALAKWMTGWSTLYVGVGPSVAFVSSDHIKETERILTPGWVYKQNMQNQNVFLDGEIPSYRSMRIAALAAVGYDIPLAPQFVLAPEIGFQMPLTSITTTDSDWSAAVLQFSIHVKFGF